MTCKDELAKAIVDNSWYKEGDFTLSSQKKSDYYIDLRPALLNTRYIHLLTTCLLSDLTAVRITSGNLLCGVITSGLFLAGAMLQRLTTVMELSAIYVRTEHRMHGALKDIEGVFEPGQEVILLDDVATSGASLARVAKLILANDLKIKAAMVVVDREEGAKELLAEMDVPLWSSVTIQDIRKHLP